MKQDYFKNERQNGGHKSFWKAGGHCYRCSGRCRSISIFGWLVQFFERADGIYSGFRLNHAKGVCVSGSFESNGRGTRLSKAVVFKAGRVPTMGRFSFAGGNPYAADGPESVRGFGLLFKLPDGEEWRTAMINTAVFGVHTPSLLRQIVCVAAGPQDRQARSGEMARFRSAPAFQ